VAVCGRSLSEVSNTKNDLHSLVTLAGKSNTLCSCTLYRIQFLPCHRGKCFDEQKG